MKLDRTTYEIYLIDYLDGKLDAVEVSELLLFLEQNPDLKEEFDGLADISLTKEGEAGSFDVSGLKKPEYNAAGKNYETLLVAKLEGDINPNQQKELDRAFALYPELKKDAGLFAQTRLQPDLTVTFKNRSRLKVFVIQPYYKIIIRVAAVLLLVSFAGIYFSKREVRNNQTATNHRVLKVEPDTKAPGENNTITKGNNEAVADTKPAHAGKKSIHPVRKQDAILPEREAVAYQQKSEVLLIQPNYKTGQEIALHNMIAPAPVNAMLRRPELPAAVASQQEFVDVRTWLARKLKKETSLSNEEGLLARINKATHADVVIEKDTTTGKLTRFEIAGIGLVSR